MLTQYHQVLTSTAFYWPSIIMYQPVLLRTDPVLSYINPHCHILTKYHPPWSQPTSDMCTVVREGAHKFWSFLGSFFGIMTKLMGSWAHSFNSWALLLGRHWTHGLICSKNCKNLKSWAPSFLTIHEQWSDAPIWNIFIFYSGLAIKQQV